MMKNICKFINAPSSQCQENNVNCQSPKCYVRDELPIVTRLRGIDRAGRWLATPPKQAHPVCTEAADLISELVGACEPFADLQHQTGAHGIISKNVGLLAPLTVTVTKEQMLRLVAALAKATQ